MGNIRCVQCGQRAAKTREGIAITCKQGWLHYSPHICQKCFDIYEAMIESVSGSTDTHGPGRQLRLRPVEAG